MTELTANRLMLLLALYRGSPMKDIAVGTFQADLMWMIRYEIVTACTMRDYGTRRTQDDVWKLSEKGQQFIKDVLEGGNRLLGITITITKET